MKKDILEIVEPIINTLQETELQDDSAVILFASNKNRISSRAIGSGSCLATLLLNAASKDKDFEMIMRAVIDFLDQQDDADNDLESK